MHSPDPPTVPVTTWHTLSAAPHRLFFLAGGIQLIAVMGLWLALLLGRSGIAPAPALSLPPAWVHAFLTLYGIYPFFVFGFLLTVYPRWLNQPAVERRAYVAVFAPLATGMVFSYFGLLMGRSAVLAVGVSLSLVGWLAGLARLFLVYRTAAADRYVRSLNTALGAGAIGLAAYLTAVVIDSHTAFAVARTLGLWLFLGLTLFTVSHRMIPFFGQSALVNYPLVRPTWSLPLAGLCLAAHALLEWLSLPQYLVLPDLPLAVVALQHTLAWNFRRSFEVKLLAMLHIAFAWFGLAMALYAARSIALLAGLDAIPPNAPLHALTVGFVTGMVIAMVSRVTLGHSGRRLWADHLTWYSFLGVNIAAVLRVVAEFGAGAYAALNIAAAMVWMVCLLGWAGHYLPIYLQPRIDGRPG